MTNLTVDFRFALGTLVFCRGAQHTDYHRPKHFVVLEQVARRCHGGVQLSYVLDDHNGMVAEVALTEDEPPYRPPSDAQVASEMAIRNQRYDADRSAWHRVVTVDHAAGEKG